MSDIVRVLSFPTTIAIGTFLGRKWPDVTHRVARSFAAVVCALLLVILATGWGHDRERLAALHRWTPHLLLTLAWSVVPFTIGVTIACARHRPLVAAGYVTASLLSLGAMFVASLTGYIGPSRGPIDPMNLVRFKVMHYGVFPAVTVALAAVGYHGLGNRRCVPTEHVRESSAEA